MKPEQPQPKKAFTWEDIHQRLAKLTRKTEAAITLPPARAREVMKERALALAHVPTPFSVAVAQEHAMMQQPVVSDRECSTNLSHE